MEQKPILTSQSIMPIGYPTESPQKSDDLRNKEPSSPKMEKDSTPKLPRVPSIIETGSFSMAFGDLSQWNVQEHRENTNNMMSEGHNLAGPVSGEESASYWINKARHLEQQLEKARLEIDKWRVEADHIAMELEQLESKYNRVLEAHHRNLASLDRLSEANIMRTFIGLGHNIAVFSDDACHKLGVDENEINQLLYQVHSDHVRPLWKLLDVTTHANHVIVAFIFQWLSKNVFPSDRPSDYWALSVESQLISDVEKLLQAGRIHLSPIMKYFTKRGPTKKAKMKVVNLG